MVKIQISGHLGKDAEVRQLADGGHVMNFSVAHSSKHTNREGVQVTNTTWVNCSYWRLPGQSLEIAKYLKKGTRVLVEGEPNARLYFDSASKPGVSIDCRVAFVELQGAAPERTESSVELQTVSTTANGNGRTLSDADLCAAAALGVSDDDLPF